MKSEQYKRITEIIVVLLIVGCAIYVIIHHAEKYSKLEAKQLNKK
tara:strand:- start:1249 stop:1383 length:135 start_codon:yes stop_codon:yes gene_type:complete